MIKVKPPGPKAKAVLAQDKKYLAQSMTRVYPLVIEKAHGATYEDVDGNKFIDFNSGIAVANVGHSNKRITRAIERQLKKISHGATLEFYAKPFSSLAEKLTKAMPNGWGLNKVFFTNSGAESIEAAMKLTRYYTGRKYWIAFDSAFHGRTYGALSMTNSKVVQRRGFGPFLDVLHVPYPNTFRFNGSENECVDWCLAQLDAMFTKKVDPKEVAAIFIEPIQGEGGYIVPPKRFMLKLRQLCTKHDILLVADEVQAGCLRTGKFLASEHFNLKPDVVCLAKALGGGLPLGAIVYKKKLDTWPPGSHASTFGGNLAACAASDVVLDLLKDKKLARKVQSDGKHVVHTLKNIQHSVPIIGDVRGIGLMVGVEIVKDKQSKEPVPKLRDRIIQKCFEKGLSLLPCGPSTIRIAPPLIINRRELDAGLKILATVLREVV